MSDRLRQSTVAWLLATYMATSEVNTRRGDSGNLLRVGAPRAVSVIVPTVGFKA